MNMTLLERARIMRLHAGLTKSFWAEAVNHACYVVNRSLSATFDCKVAEEVWTGKEVDYSTLKLFGCPAYAHIPSDERSKLYSQSLKCIFLRFKKRVKGYKLWDPVNRKKIISKDVVFDQKSMLNMEQDGEVKGHSVEKAVVEIIPLIDNKGKKPVQSQTETSTSSGEEKLQVRQEPTSLAHGRAKTNIKSPQRF